MPYYGIRLRSLVGLIAVLAILGAGSLDAWKAFNLASASGRTVDSADWLEDIRGQRALAWVRAQNARTLEQLRSDTRFKSIYEAAKAVYEDGSRVSGVTQSSGWVYDVKKDDHHPRGLWRRAKLSSYLNGKPRWQQLLDIDALSEVEGKSWNFNRAEFYRNRCLVFLEGNAGHYAIREYDLVNRTFLERGFQLPEHFGQSAVWNDENSIIVASNWGAGSLTNRGGGYGFPYVLKEWNRGTDLPSAREVFRGDPSDDFVLSSTYQDETGAHSIVFTRVTKGVRSHFLLDAALRPIRMSVPATALIHGIHRGEWVIQLRQKDWSPDEITWPQGSILSIPATDISLPTPTVRPIMESHANEPVWLAKVSHEGVLVISLNNVRGQLSLFKWLGTTWQRNAIKLPQHGYIGVPSVDPASNLALVTSESFLQPPVVHVVNLSTHSISRVAASKAHFDSTPYTVDQHVARSSDGTEIPYTIVRPQAFTPNSNTPTILWAYGSGGVIEWPRYDGVLGKVWLENGGIYVQASIRGGGEHGPSWHVRGIDRQHTYDDFVAVAEDLIRNGVTSREYLGIRGHSNGGLLVGVVLNLRPDLFGAAVIENPLLDLLYGSRTNSHEFGSLNSEPQRQFIEQTSPYHNLQWHQNFPASLITTAVDDGAGFVFSARKYARKLEQYQMPFFYYESDDGGHGFGTTPEQRATHDALVYTHFSKMLMDRSLAIPQRQN